MNERRKFLVKCGTAALIAGLGPLLANAGRLTPSARSTRVGDRFRELLNQRFVLFDPASGAETTVRLAAVNDGPEQPGLEQFSLRFDSAGRNRLSEGTYQVRSGGIHSFDLFVSPVGDAGSPAAYRAHFSLIA